MNTIDPSFSTRAALEDRKKVKNQALQSAILQLLLLLVSFIEFCSTSSEFQSRQTLITMVVKLSVLILMIIIWHTKLYTRLSKQKRNIFMCFYILCLNISTVELMLAKSSDYIENYSESNHRQMDEVCFLIGSFEITLTLVYMLRVITQIKLNILSQVATFIYLIGRVIQFNHLESIFPASKLLLLSIFVTYSLYPQTVTFPKLPNSSNIINNNNSMNNIKNNNPNSINNSPNNSQNNFVYESQIVIGSPSNPNFKGSKQQQIQQTSVQNSQKLQASLKRQSQQSYNQQILQSLGQNQNSTKVNSSSNHTPLLMGNSNKIPMNQFPENVDKDRGLQFSFDLQNQDASQQQQQQLISPNNKKSPFNYDPPTNDLTQSNLGNEKVKQLKSSNTNTSNINDQHKSQSISAAQLLGITNNEFASSRVNYEEIQLGNGENNFSKASSLTHLNLNMINNTNINANTHGNLPNNSNNIDQNIKNQDPSPRRQTGQFEAMNLVNFYNMFFNILPEGIAVIPLAGDMDGFEINQTLNSLLQCDNEEKCLKILLEMKNSKLEESQAQLAQLMQSSQMNQSVSQAFANSDFITNRTAMTLSKNDGPIMPAFKSSPDIQSALRSQQLKKILTQADKQNSNISEKIFQNSASTMSYQQQQQQNRQQKQISFQESDDGTYKEQKYEGKQNYKNSLSIENNQDKPDKIEEFDDDDEDDDDDEEDDKEKGKEDQDTQQNYNRRQTLKSQTAEEQRENYINDKTRRITFVVDYSNSLQKSKQTVSSNEIAQSMRKFSITPQEIRSSKFYSSSHQQQSTKQLPKLAEQQQNEFGQSLNGPAFISPSKFQVELTQSLKSTVAKEIEHIKNQLESLESKESYEMIGVQVRMVSKCKLENDVVKYFEIIFVPCVIKSEIAVVLVVKDITHFNEIEVLKNVNENKSQMLSQVAHEIRTPLNCVIGMLEISKELAGIEITEAYLSPALTSARLLNNLIQDLLDMAQVKAGCFQLKNTNFSLPDLLQEISQLMKIQAQAANIEMRVDFNENLPQQIHSDPFRIRQIVINLIGNALKFTQKGSITISAEKFPFQNIEGIVKIAVKDTGIGIQAKQKQKLFKAFGKLDDDHQESLNPKGVGLGLMISNELAKKLSYPIFTNQGLEVTSQYGKGSEFSFIVIDNTPIQNSVAPNNPVSDQSHLDKYEFKPSLKIIPYTRSNNSNKTYSLQRISEEDVKFRSVGLISLGTTQSPGSSQNISKKQFVAPMFQNHHSKSQEMDQQLEDNSSPTSNNKLSRANDSPSKFGLRLMNRESTCFTTHVQQIFTAPSGNLSQSNQNINSIRIIDTNTNNPSFINQQDLRQELQISEENEENIVEAQSSQRTQYINSPRYITASSHYNSTPYLHQQQTSASNTSHQQIFSNSPQNQQSVSQYQQVSHNHPNHTQNSSQFYQASQNASSSFSNQHQQLISSSNDPKQSSFQSSSSHKIPMIPQSQINLKNLGVNSPTNFNPQQSRQYFFNGGNQEFGNIGNPLLDTRESMSPAYTMKKTKTKEEFGNPGFPQQTQQSDISSIQQCSCNRVLVVDDNMFNVYVLKQLLKVLRHLDCDSALSGQQAIKCIQSRWDNQDSCCKQNYQLVFMDVDMPIMNGIETSASIRKQFVQLQSTMMIVGCSGFSNSSTEHEQCVAAGMNDYLTKPIDKTALIGILDKYLVS